MSVAVTVKLDGLPELQAVLRNLPDALTGEAREICTAAASEAQRDIVAGYPRGRTGNLQNGVRLEQQESHAAIVVTVRSRAPHAWIFEHGTGNRRTDKGWSRGKMPPASTSAAFIPKAIRARRRMYEAFAAFLEAHGFEVSL